MNKPLELLQQWVDAGWLRHLDRALARWVAELDPQARPELLMATALLVQAAWWRAVTAPDAPARRRAGRVLALGLAEGAGGFFDHGHGLIARRTDAGGQTK